MPANLVERLPVAWRYRGPKGGWITVETPPPAAYGAEPLFSAAEIERLEAELNRAREKAVIGEYMWTPAEMAKVVSRAEAAEARCDKLAEALSALVNAKALQGVREIVAGWNGENLPDGERYGRHPEQLGATLPKTTCGAIYELDETLVSAREALEQVGKR